LAETHVQLNLNGEQQTVQAGGSIMLKPGDPARIRHRQYHQYWGPEGGCIVLNGEVSPASTIKSRRTHCPWT
jgi:D-lyxose ketol-isomerase